MCVVELEPCDVWRETERKARKEHRCGCCGRRILTGESYRAIFGVYEGEVFSGKYCGACREAAGEFSHAHEIGLPTPESLVELLQECVWDGEEEIERRWKPMLEQIRARGVAA